MAPSLEGWPTKAKEALSLHEVRLVLLDTKPVFYCLDIFNVIKNDANSYEALSHQIPNCSITVPIGTF